MGQSMPKPRRITSADLPYWFEDIVYLRVREEKKKGMVTGIGIRPGGTTYFVTWEEGESDHYDFELTSEFIPDYDTPEVE
jgi:hypothetical protein